jgi:hypothetical protein
MPLPSHLLKPAQIAMLNRVLEIHCHDHGIRTSEGRASVAKSIMARYLPATSEADLLAALDQEDNPVAQHTRSSRTLDGEAGIIAVNQM